MPVDDVLDDGHRLNSTAFWPGGFAFVFSIVMCLRPTDPALGSTQLGKKALVLMQNVGRETGERWREVQSYEPSAWRVNSVGGELTVRAVLDEKTAGGRLQLKLERHREWRESQGVVSVDHELSGQVLLPETGIVDVSELFPNDKVREDFEVTEGTFRIRVVGSLTE